MIICSLTMRNSTKTRSLPSSVRSRGGALAGCRALLWGWKPKMEVGEL